MASIAPTDGQDVEVGDDLWFLGKVHRITRIKPYAHPVVTKGETWRIAYADEPSGVYQKAWSITLEPRGHYNVMKAGAR